MCGGGLGVLDLVYAKISTRLFRAAADLGIATRLRSAPALPISTGLSRVLVHICTSFEWSSYFGSAIISCAG